MPKDYLTPEERLFADRVEDMFSIVDSRSIPKFSSFLDERQQAIVKQVAPQGNYLLYAGHPGEGDRLMLGVFPDYCEPDGSLFPIVPITVRYRRQDTLSHRDFLGALMGLMIKREAIGDILVGEGLSVLFVTEPVAGVVLGELLKVGSCGVSCEQGLPDELPSAHQYRSVGGTVSSLRLDCVVALLTNLSREKASQLIRSGLVSKNAQTMDSISKEVAEGDKLSIRGYGKFLVGSVGTVTKKGRIHLECKKYI